MPTKQEFIDAFKEKNPAYADKDSNELYDKLITKYPQYADKITPDTP
jgi:hypothetical protein